MAENSFASTSNSSMQRPKEKDTAAEEPTFRVFKPARQNAGSPLRAFQVVLSSYRQLTITLLLPEALPDSYFTPTAADLKSAQATLSARTQALTNAPLQLRAVREAEERAKRDRWPKV
jgi:tether containing UBX domain for GLUT4